MRATAIGALNLQPPCLSALTGTASKGLVKLWLVDPRPTEPADEIWEIATGVKWGD